ncbi:MAG: hypothetical protein R2834_05745 [Rhodothermales bacterium]
MTRKNLFLIPLCLLVASCGQPSVRERAEGLLAGASAYLWAQQAGDGGWHSETHGIVRGGQAWTPFILHALLTTSPAARDSDAARAVAFIRAHIDSAGAVGRLHPIVLEYPNYASAFALRVLARDDATAGDAGRIARYLLGQHFTEPRGIFPEHPAYGAWGFGEVGLPSGGVGHVDLSHTRRVLQALREAGVTDSLVYARAATFLGRLQKRDAAGYDGGFHYAPLAVFANKGGFEPDAGGVPIYASYATTTCDGLLALLAAGVPPSDARVRDAVAWLRDHPRLDYPEGIPAGQAAGWDEAIFFYHLMVRAEVYRALDWPDTGWRGEIVSLLETRVRPDGSFANPAGAPNKEDDPLLATAFALVALGALVH